MRTMKSKVKPKEIQVNLPAAHLFSTEDEISALAAAINTIIHGKVKIKCESLGVLGGQYVGLFYVQRNNESQEIHDEFMRLIEQEEMVAVSSFGSNGGVQCDTDRGPCACGAWHKPGELWPEITHTLCIDCDELMMLHQKGLDHCSCGCEWSKGKCESQ